MHPLPPRIVYLCDNYNYFTKVKHSSMHYISSHETENIVYFNNNKVTFIAAN